MKWCSRAQKVIEVHLEYGNSTTEWQFYTFSSKFHSNIYSILFAFIALSDQVIIFNCVFSTM